MQEIASVFLFVLSAVSFLAAVLLSGFDYLDKHVLRLLVISAVAAACNLFLL